MPSITTGNNGFGQPVPGGYTGWTTAGTVPYSTTQTLCACGQPATRSFFNPKGISYNLEELVPMFSLCSGCDFRFTVMRAAGRSEEFIADYEEKQKVRAEEELKRQEEYMKQAQQAYAQQQAQAAQNSYGIGCFSGRQNVYGTQQAEDKAAREVLREGLAPSPAPCTENVQSPEEQKSPWWKVW
jgi:hypothetical protein